jgi:hypothetical protein
MEYILWRMRSLVIVFEVVTAMTILLVLLIQRPGVTTTRYALKHHQEELQQKRREAAKLAEDQFGRQHRVAQFILYKAGGIGLWVAGLCVVIVSAPKVLSPRWLNSAFIGSGLGVQVAATSLFVFWGLRSSRSIWKAVRAKSSEK